MNSRAGIVTAAVIAVILAAAGGVWFGRSSTSSAVPEAAVQPPSAPAPQAAHEQMDRDAMHEASVKAFPAKTAGLGAQPIQPEIVNGVKVFRLTASQIQWEVEVGVKRLAFAYNGQVPGPTIRVTEGDRVRVILTNRLSQSTSIHFHGVFTPNAMDGVPYITQPPVKPGATFTYEFVAKPSGTHMYHAHHGPDQITLGLLGAFIIEPKDARREPKVAQDIVLVINDGPLGYTLNGKSFPATQPIVVKRGQRFRIRYMNEGSIIHPMHLHGLTQLVIAKDGRPLREPYEVDTLNVAPGERYDVLVNADAVGVWAFHCHILAHAESETGMHGMVTAVIVK
ncbi:MAG TPA: multicopper oxidase domain-containing protein [bacterium]